MDSGTTSMTINSLSQILMFMQHVFPWISLLVLFLTAVIVMLKEKRKRAFCLEQSEEEARIRALDIDEAYKEQLLKAAALLPVSKEAFPLPDLPLRLVSALAKVFGWLKLVLQFGAVYSMMRIRILPGSTRTIDGPVVVGVLLLLEFILLAVLQIAASTRVTRGNNLARRFLIFMAVLDLGTVMYDPNMAYALLWRAILVAMSAYTLWALVLRKGAQEAVTYHAVSTRQWQKAVLVIVSLFFVFTTPFDTKVETRNTSHKLETNTSSGDHEPAIKLPILRIYLQAGDESRATTDLMENIKENLTVSAELLAFDQAALHTICGGELLLLVSKTLDQQKEKQSGEKVDRKFLKMLAKADPEMARRFYPQPSGDKKIAFEINTPFNYQNFSWKSDGSDLLPMSSLDLQITTSAEYNRGSRESTLEALGKDVAKNINGYISKHNAKTIITSLPEALTVEPEPLPPPAYGFMTNACLKASYVDHQQQINLYKAGEYSSNAFLTVSNELVAAGWKHDYQGRFVRNKNRETMTVLGPAWYGRQEPLPYLYVVYSKNRKPDLPEGFAIDLCQNSYADFISIFKAEAVSEEILKKVTLDYLQQSDLSAKQLNKVYKSISTIESLDSIKPNLLMRFAEKLHEEPMSEYVFSLYQDLAKQMATRNSVATNSLDRIKALYADQIVQLELARDTNGFARAETTLSLKDRPQIITLGGLSDSLPESRIYVPYFLLWQEVFQNGQCKSYYDSPYGSGSSESSEFQGHRLTLCGLLSDGYGHVGMSSGGFSDQYCSVEDMTEPGNLTLLAYSNPDNSDELIVKVALNENEPEEKIE